MKLEDIKDPTFLKNKSIPELNELSKDIRHFLVDSISKTGGHLASNLGVVELTVALHKVFDSPRDKIFRAFVSTKVSLAFKKEKNLFMMFGNQVILPHR